MIKSYSVFYKLSRIVFFTPVLVLYATIIGTLAPAFVVAGASDVPFANEPFDVNNIPEPVPPPPAVREFFDLDPFYQQWINVEGFPVLGSEKVSPYALKETAWLTWQMVGDRRDLINAFVQKKVHFVIMAHNEVLSDIPEFSPNHVDFLVYDIRGEGGRAVVGHPTPTTGEENVLRDSSLSRGYSTLIHELAHVAHLFGLKVVDPTFDDRLKRAYDRAIANGLWQGTYAASNSEEYWAEGTHAWFYPQGGGSFTGDTRQELKTYDPPLASLLTEVYDDSNWQYTPLGERTHLPHLQGFNPQDAPTFQPSQELVETYKKFRNPNSAGEGKWVDLSPYDPRFLRILNESRIADSWTMIAFINLTQADILLYWVSRDGTARFWKRLRPHRDQWTPTRPGAIYLIKDANGRDIALFQAVKKTGRALITSTLNLITPGLSKVSGDNQSGISGTVLSNPFVIEVRDETLSALEGISVTFTVTAGNGMLSTTRTTTDHNGRAESTLTLGDNLGTNTVSVSAAGIAGAVTFTAVAEAMVDIPDQNLRTAIEDVLGVSPGAPIAPADMATLTRLEAMSAGIRNLTGVEHATNLEVLLLGANPISDLSPLTGLTQLKYLNLQTNEVITDISSLSGLTSLNVLGLGWNNITNISAISGLTNLTYLNLHSNNISDLSPLVANTGLGGLVDVRENPLNRASIKTHIPALQNRGVRVNFDDIIAEPVTLPDPNLHAAVARAVGKASSASLTTVDMAKLTRLEAREAGISNLTGLEGATNLIKLSLGGNSISDISPVVSLTQLTRLSLWTNSISDISPVAGLTHLTELNLSGNLLSSIAAVTGLTQLTWLHLQSNAISDISALSGLTELTELRLDRNSITDLSPLVANTGLGSGDRVDVSVNPLSYTSIKTHIPILRSRGVEVRADNLKPTTSEYTLSIPAGISMIHVPLKVTKVDGVAKTIESISDLYAALGGDDAVIFLMTYDSQQGWLGYWGTSDTGTAADRTLTDDMGIYARLIVPVSVQLTGETLGTIGSGTITLNQGLNLVGLPLRDSRITRVSDLFTLDGIRGNVFGISLADDGEFKTVGQAGDPGDIPVTGGQSFILTAQRSATVTISGEAWTNVSETAAAPSLSLKGIEVGDVTPVLALRGTIVDEQRDLNQSGFRVTVKNLSTGKAFAAVTAPDERGYRVTVVDIETSRAATVGDVLEISAQSPNPFIGVGLLRYTLTAEDVKRSLIQLPELVAYEIPAETQLLANYPNPFNPETWIPYRLATDAFVTLTIYDQTGQVVRTLEVGHRIAAVYEDRSKAIYWDGRNEFGETVANGIYFYQLSAGDYSATRKAVILK